MSAPRLHKAILALGLALGAQAHAAGLTMLQTNALQTQVTLGQLITVEVQVQNAGSGTLNAVSANATVWLDGVTVSAITDFLPISVTLAGGLDQVFVFTYSASACGVLSFSTGASAYDPIASAVVDATGTTTASASALIQVCAVTPSPTPTAPATPGPELRGDATIRGNIFRPDRGAPLTLSFSAPQGGVVNITIFDRTGKILHRIERDLAPGNYTELWDGRVGGALAPSGVYLARFQGRGLSKIVKFAIIK